MVDFKLSKFYCISNYSCNHCRVGSALSLPVPDQSVNLITAATCLHWLNKDLFFSEVKRVLKPGGVLAVYSSNAIYPVTGDMEIDTELRQLTDKVCIWRFHTSSLDTQLKKKKHKYGMKSTDNQQSIQRFSLKYKKQDSLLIFTSKGSFEITFRMAYYFPAQQFYTFPFTTTFINYSYSLAHKFNFTL